MAINRVYLNHPFILPLHTDHNHYVTTASSGKVVTAPAGADAARCAIQPKSNSFVVQEGDNPSLTWPTEDGNTLCADPVMMDLQGAERTITLSSSDDSIVFIDWFRFNPIPYPLGGVVLNGTNNYLEHTGDITGVTDTDQVTIMFWAQANPGTDGIVLSLLSSSDGSIAVYRDTDNTVGLTITDINGNTISGNTVGTITESSPWTQILISISTANYSEPTILTLFNGVDQEFTVSSNTFNDTQIAMTGYDAWWVGAGSDDGDPTDFFDGNISAVLLKTDVALDFADTQVVATFIDNTGLPVNLGADGSTPFLAQANPTPQVYLTLLASETDPDVLAANRGSGGTFTVEGDALELSTTSPTNQ